MARFFGKVGFGSTAEETSDSGLWKDVITEKDFQEKRAIRHDGEPFMNYTSLVG